MIHRPIINPTPASPADDDPLSAAETKRQLGESFLRDASAVFTFGQYEILGKIGEGGMGLVFLARQVFDRAERRYRPVAIKTPHPNKTTAEYAHMLSEEAMALAETSSDDVVTILDFGRFSHTDRGALREHPYISMEYVAGATLAELISQLNQVGERCPPALAAALIARACHGLHAIHQVRDKQNVRRCHRDVKPSNIMLTSTGGIKLLDLGTVSSPRPRQFEGGSAPAPLGLPMTAAYAAPELLRAGKSTPQADIYSLGLILHELVTGARYAGSKQELARAGSITAFDRGEYEPSEDAAPWIRARIAEMLRADPSERPVTAAALAEELSDDVCREDPTMLQEEKRLHALAALGFQFRGHKSVDRIWPFREHRLQSTSVANRQAPTPIPLDAPGEARHLVSDLEMTVDFKVEQATAGRPCTLTIPSGGPGGALELNAYPAKTSVELQLMPGQPGRIYLSERGPSQMKIEWLTTTQGSFYVGERGQRTKLYCQYQPLKGGRAVTVASLRASFAVADARVSHLLTLHTDPTEYAVNVYCIGVY